MRVFIDTNVLLDVALRRGEFVEASTQCLSWCQESAEETYIAWHSVSNLFYIACRNSGKDTALEYIDDLVTWLDIAPATKLEVLNALASPGKDFEDTLQLKCAESAHCDVLVTRNPKDFADSDIPVLSPTEFCTKFI